MAGQSSWPTRHRSLSKRARGRLHQGFKHRRAGSPQPRDSCQRQEAEQLEDGAQPSDFLLEDRVGPDVGDPHFT